MATNEHGLPVPKKDEPHFKAKMLTFRYAVYQTDDHLDWSTSECECMANYAFAMAKENQNLRDIVRRLAEWAKSDLMDDIDDIIDDAVRTWDRMQREAKGDE